MVLNNDKQKKKIIFSVCMLLECASVQIQRISTRSPGWKLLVRINKTPSHVTHLFLWYFYLLQSLSEDRINSRSVIPSAFAACQDCGVSKTLRCVRGISYTSEKIEFSEPRGCILNNTGTDDRLVPKLHLRERREKLAVSISYRHLYL